MENRLSEILKGLQEKHNIQNNSANVSYEQFRCDFANNNPGDLNQSDGYNCDICKNKGIIYFVDKYPFTGNDYMTARECKCMAIRRTLRRAKNSGLGNILSDFTFAKYETPEDWQKHIKSMAQQFCNDDTANWFYIGGQSGAGKSHICTAIAGHYIKQGKDCRYMLWRDDAVKLKALVSDYEGYKEHIAEFKNIPVLYIDDFLKTQSGTEPTQADMNLAFELLNYRLIGDEKITIISSEYTLAKALEFDEATIGRIYQQTGVYKINIDKDMAKNYRLRG